MKYLRLLAVLSLTMPSLACIEYKAEPEDGKQSCASTGTKLCPDNYQCRADKKCYKEGSSATGGTAGGGASGTKASSTSGSSMACSDAGMTCNMPGDLAICCDNSQCKYLAGGREFPCAGFDCQTAAQDAVDYCTGWSTGGAGGSQGGSSGQAGAKSSSSKASGGSSGTVTGSGDTVTFRYGQAVSPPMTGYGWIALGAKDILTDPTCGDFNERITQSQPCTTMTNWNSASALCISGTIPALPTSPVKEDYDANWGIQIGVNVTEPPTGSLDRSYSTISFSVSNAPTGGFRIVLHRTEDPDTTSYCYDGALSGKAVSLQLFNTKCWGETGTVYLLQSDVPSIDKVGLQVSSLQSSISLSNLCLNSITFGK